MFHHEAAITSLSSQLPPEEINQKFIAIHSHSNTYNYKYLIYLRPNLLYRWQFSQSSCFSNWFRVWKIWDWWWETKLHSLLEPTAKKVYFSNQFSSNLHKHMDGPVAIPTHPFTEADHWPHWASQSAAATQATKQQPPHIDGESFS